jgi:hypothetical protein
METTYKQLQLDNIGTVQTRKYEDCEIFIRLNGKWGVADKEGKIILIPVFTYLSYFDSGYYYASFNNTFYGYNPFTGEGMFWNGDFQISHREQCYPIYYSTEYYRRKKGFLSEYGPEIFSIKNQNSISAFAVLGILPPMNT